MEAVVRRFSLSPTDKNEISSAHQQGTLDQIGRWIFFAILMLFEFIPPMLGGVMYAKESLAMIVPYVPFIIPAGIMTAIGVACVFCSLFGMICFIAPSLIEKIGIIKSENKHSLPYFYTRQLQATERMNALLLQDSDWSGDEFKQFHDVCSVMNEEMIELKNHYPAVKEKWYLKIFTGCMTTLTIIQAISGSLFMAAGIAGWWTGSVLAGALLAANMPITIALLAIVFFVPQIAMSFYLRVASAEEMLDTEKFEYEQVKNQLSVFKEIPKNQVERIYSKKINNEINKFDESFIKRLILQTGVNWDIVKIKKENTEANNTYTDCTSKCKYGGISHPSSPTTRERR